jgi:hypothetical protein
LLDVRTSLDAAEPFVEQDQEYWRDGVIRIPVDLNVRPKGGRAIPQRQKRFASTRAS